MFLRPIRLKGKGCIIAVGALFMVAILHVISRNRGDSLEDSLRLLPSTNVKRPSSHRHLFHIFDIHSSLLDRFKLIDLSSRYDVIKFSEASRFNCTISKSVPSFNICLYEQDKDRYISAALISDGLWEPYITRAFQVALTRFPDALVVDIGANIGYYSLLASAMGNRVIAIEPQEENIDRLVAGVCADKLHDNIMLLANALSDRHMNVSLSVSEDNQGGIRVVENCDEQSWIFGKMKVGKEIDDIACNVSTLTMDDLLYIATTRDAVIKVDIEGYECKALAMSARFFSSINVPYVFMEWRQMTDRQHLVDTACPPVEIRALGHFFANMGYIPHEIRSGISLNPFHADKWMVGDIYWRARGQDLLVPSL